MKKIGIVAVLLIATVPFFVHAYVSPGRSTGFVNDFAGILSASEKSTLETRLSDYEKQTGNEISIVTVISLDGEIVDTYANKLFKEWGIGKKDKDNGLLILHAPNERKVWIEVGYGLEQYITDAKASSVYRNVLSPAFKRGDYIQGYTEALNVIIATLGGDQNAITEDKSIDWASIVYLILFLIWWLVSILGRSKSWWLGGIIGGILGISIGIANISILIGIVATIIFVAIGLIFDFIVSKAYHSSIASGGHPPWWIGGGRGGSGGFGGFGGGGSGGGGGGGGY